MDVKRRRVSPPLIRIGGVPEHFNFPLLLARELGLFDKYGVEVEFVEQKLGTGAMIKATKSGEIDACIALTEGLVADIAQGSDLRLLGTYVKSPLCWAISVGKGSAIGSVEDLRGRTFGVSRLQSGSHLMAYVLAGERGWRPQEDVHFEVKGSFEELRKSVNDGSTDAFMWETFTTKPFHDSGEIKRVGDITTPWPCFMMAAREAVVTENLEGFEGALAAIHEAVTIFRDNASIPERIAQTYNLQLADAKAWYHGVNIVAERFISEASLHRVVDTLKLTGVLPELQEVHISSLIDKRLAELSFDIMSMPLYSATGQPALVVSLHRQLAAAGLSSGNVSYEKFLPFDQHHYGGTPVLDALVAEHDITSASRVLNIGSGLGGPARYLAGRVGCKVVACEIQSDLHRTALELSKRSGLAEKISHIHGDFLREAAEMDTGSFDVIVCWLTVLHFNDRAKLFEHIHRLLNPGGVFVASDFYERGKLKIPQWQILHREIGCPGMPSSLESFQHELEVAGFKVTQVQDLSEEWTDFAKERVAGFGGNHKLKEVIGEDVHASLLRFYTLVRDLYASGNLGGCHIVAQKGTGW